jgi:hypothetical protein
MDMGNIGIIDKDVIRSLLNECYAKGEDNFSISRN